VTRGIGLLAHNDSEGPLLTNDAAERCVRTFL